MDTKKMHAMMAVVVFVFALIGTQAFAAGEEQVGGQGVYGQEQPVTGTRTSDPTYDRERSEMGGPKDAEGHKIYGQEKEPPQMDPRSRERAVTEQRGRMVGTMMPTRASEIIGLNVKDRTGEQLGEVEDIVIGKDGRVQYIIISHGGVLGIGENMVPIPYKTAEVDVEQDAIVLKNVDKQMLEKAPNFSDEDWANIGEPAFEQKVNSYYGQEKPGYRSGEKKEKYQEHMDRKRMDQEKQMREQEKQK